MKVLVVIGVGAVMMALAAALYLKGQSREPSVVAEAPGKSGLVLMVDDLRDDAGRLQGVIEVQGVVGGSSAERQLLGLIDTREVEACGGIDCPEFILPVQWDGEVPALGQTVSVKGQVRTTDEGLLLAASEVTAQ